MSADGRGDRLYLGGVDLSGDTSAIPSISGGWETASDTDITQGATARILTRQHGQISWVSYFNPTTAHPLLKTLPRADVIATYVSNQGPAAGLIALQADYPGAVAPDGSFLLPINLASDGTTLEWGKGYVGGTSRTDTAPTAGAGIDDGTPTTTGLTAYFQVTALTGPTATITLEHSADNGATDPWAVLLTATPVTAAPTAQRTTTPPTTTARRWVRARTSGTFTALQFHAMALRSSTAGS